MRDPVLTIKQPWSDLILAGVKDVENRSWPAPSTLPQHRRCMTCGARESFDGRGYAILDCDHPGWSELIPDGPFPFRLWIHAGASLDHSVQANRAWVEHVRIGMRTGVLLGSVTVTGCHEWTECEEVRPWEGWSLCSPWAQEPEAILRDLWHWELADPVPLDEPIPMRGRQRLWRLPEPLEVPA